MRELFAKRRRVFQEQCLKYARYVFNDHFILFLLVALGFLAVQYSQLLRNFPKDPLPIVLALVVFSLFILPFGKISTYAEKADSLFLLVKEEEMKTYVKNRSLRAYLFWGTIQTLLLLLLAPLFLAVGLPFWGFLFYLLFMLAVKGLIFQRKIRQFYKGTALNWQKLIEYEERRRQTVLRFFALFTNVKGISNSVKRRAYLDGFTKLLAKEHSQTWSNLYLRSYLRNGDLFGLTLRLLLLSVLAILFIAQSWIAAAFVLLFTYLLLFQLLALYNAFDYQYLTRLFPLEEKDKVKGAKKIITSIGCSVLFLELAAALLCFQEKTPVLLILGGSLLLYLLYLPYKLKRLVDERT